MRTDRGFDRIVNFSDATVAIAMTLLVLPLVDLVGEKEEYPTVWALLRENGNELFGFVLGFLVIWTMWVSHHRTMEYFATYDDTVITLHLIWLLTMVSIPFTTQLITDDHYSKTGATALYVGVLFVASLCLHLLAMRGRRHPELLADDDEVRNWMSRPFRWTTTLLLGVISVAVFIFPAIGAWPLLLLFVDGFIESRLRARDIPSA